MILIFPLSPLFSLWWNHKHDITSSFCHYGSAPTYVRFNTRLPFCGARWRGVLPVHKNKLLLLNFPDYFSRNRGCSWGWFGVTSEMPEQKPKVNNMVPRLYKWWRRSLRQARWRCPQAAEDAHVKENEYFCRTTRALTWGAFYRML